MVFVPGVSHGYDGEKNFVFDELKVDALIESGVLITKIIMRVLKTALFIK